MDTVYQLLRTLLPFEWAQYEFMLNGLLAVALLAPACAAMGVHVVNFRMAFFSDAIAHSAFTGVVLGYLLAPFFVRAYPGAADWGVVLPSLTLVLFGMAVGAGINAVRRGTDLSADTVIGVFFASVIAIGLALITAQPNLKADFQNYLYGSILTVTKTDVLVILTLAVIVLAFLVATFNSLMLIGLNESLAHSRRLRVEWLTYAYTLLLAVVVTVSIRAVGLFLVTALLVVPAAAGRNLARGIAGMFWWSAGIGLASGVAGLILSFYCDNSAGSMVILTAAACFALSMAAARRR
ncbi:MAG: metal ABC transporter permease [Phycisphaerae bacterium]|nr:metal ABC transporter permease [Phycisphaerae bacterium]